MPKGKAKSLAVRIHGFLYPRGLCTCNRDSPLHKLINLKSEEKEEIIDASMRFQQSFYIKENVAMQDEICKLAAKIYAGKDWLDLTSDEALMVSLLEHSGYIIPSLPTNGYVGRAKHE